MHVCVCYHYPFIPWPHIYPPSFDSAMLCFSPSAERPRLTLTSSLTTTTNDSEWDWTVLNSKLHLCFFTQKMITASHSPATDKHQHYNKKEAVLVCGETRPPSGTNISEWKPGVSYCYLYMWWKYDLQRKGSSAHSIPTHQRCDSNSRTLKRKIEPAFCQQPQYMCVTYSHTSFLFILKRFTVA